MTLHVVHYQWDAECAGSSTADEALRLWQMDGSVKRKTETIQFLNVNGVQTTTHLLKPAVDHCLKDLSNDQGDPHYQEVSAHDPGGVNGTRSSSHDAGLMCCPLWAD